MRQSLASLLTLGAMLVAQGVDAREPTLEQALEAPSGDLAISYLNARIMIDATASVGAGVEIVTPEGSVKSNNAAKVREAYEARRQIYGDAINKRGYSTVLAGSYRVRSAGSACDRTYSTLLTGASSSAFKSLTIEQQGPDIILTAVSRPPAGSPPDYGDFSDRFVGAVVENVIAVIDPWNATYMVEGLITDTRIEWHARPEVLKFWPNWAPGPTAADIAECRVVFEREH